MMQNGFRRIALAQGLLPDRLMSPAVPPSFPPSAAQCPDAAPAPGPAASACDSDRDMLVAGAA
jgi:hypothetical protein